MNVSFKDLGVYKKSFGLAMEIFIYLKNFREKKHIR